MRKLRLNPLGGVKRRLNGVNEGLHALQRLTSTSHAIQACVKNEEHKDLLFAMLQMGLWVSVDSRKSCIENTKKYLNAVRPAKLDNLVRIGGKMDGGYVMLPPPPPLSNSQPKAVSLGVSDFSPWDLEMANMGYQVLQYDASIEKAPDTHKNMIFHKKFVGATRDHQTITFDDIMQQYSFNEKDHNILQMDIEGAEWEIFERLDFSIFEKYFSQIILEFHDCDPRASLQTERHVAILERFHHAFQPIHLHFNPYGHNFYVKDRFMANVFEVSYARKDLLPRDFTLLNECGDIPNLDYPNGEKLPNIPISF